MQQYISILPYRITLGSDPNFKLLQSLHKAFLVYVLDWFWFLQDGRLLLENTQRLLLDCDLHDSHTYQCGINNGSEVLRSNIWSAFIHGKYIIIYTNPSS